MARVGDSVRKAIDDWSSGDFDFAMLHACNAVDGSDKKAYPQIKGSNSRFTQCLRDNYAVLGPMGLPGIDIVNTRWRVKLEYPKATGGGPDIADVIYGIHRCTHGHGEELPGGFELIADAAGQPEKTNMVVKRGQVQLSDRVIFALLGVAVFSPVNRGQRVPDGDILTFGREVWPINEWWGRMDDARKLLAGVALPNVKIDFADWMHAAK